MVMTTKPGSNLRIGNRAFALALLAAPFVAADRAEAACTPASPVNNATVTCTGTTNGQNGANGYGQSTDNGNTINVLSGASVTGTNNGINLGSGTAVNNAGAVGGVSGVSIFTGNVTNSGVISATDGFGIAAITVAVANSGTISASGFG